MYNAKFRGGMIGSALGDAIGELAFKYPVLATLQSRLSKTDLYRYTDDTAMAIRLAESIINVGVIDEKHLGNIFAANYVKEPWRGYAWGPPYIFETVQITGNTYTDTARTLFNGTGSFGNGAAMRIAHLGLFFCNSSDIYEQACRSASVTHTHPLAMDGAAVLAYAIAKVVNIDPKEEFSRINFINSLINFSKETVIQDKLVTVKKLLIKRCSSQEAAERLGQGVAIHESMPFAVYSFLNHLESFKDCLYCAILNGGDRDTLGAMACSISGAYLGIEAVPVSWQEKLENRKYIEFLALKLLEKQVSSC